MCLGTLPLRCPRNVLVDFALSQLDTTITLFTRVVQTGMSRRIGQNLEWLTQLRVRIADKIIEAQSLPDDGLTLPLEGDAEDSGLLGWRTRLIERASKGNQTATTIRTTPKTATPSPLSYLPQNHTDHPPSLDDFLGPQPHVLNNDITARTDQLVRSSSFSLLNWLT